MWLILAKTICACVDPLAAIGNIASCFSVHYPLRLGLMANNEGAETAYWMNGTPAHDTRCLDAHRYGLCLYLGRETGLAPL